MSLAFSNFQDTHSIGCGALQEKTSPFHLISFVVVSVSTQLHKISLPPSSLDSSLSLCLTWLYTSTPLQVPLVAIDSVYYGRPVLAPLNIVLYNVFGKGGPNLYGIISAKLPNSFTVVLLLHTFNHFRCGAIELLSYQWSTELQCCLHPGPPCPTSCRIPGVVGIHMYNLVLRTWQ